MITMQQALEYEVHSSFWSDLIWWGWGQKLAATYFVRKVERKYVRYYNHYVTGIRLKAEAEAREINSRDVKR